jgi:hypothetical protein
MRRTGTRAEISLTRLISTPAARAKIFDLGLEGNRAERIRRLGDVLRLEFDAFTFRLKPEIHEMELADTVRVEVAVQYKTRAWQTVDIDLGPGGAREVDLLEPAITGLAEMGLPMVPHVRCLGINEQVAQKLHACTGPQREDRARDVLDILLVDMLGQLDYVRTRTAAERIFAERATHAFPPMATLPAEWRRELENLAQELGYRTTNAEGIEAEFAAVLQAIATAVAT